MRFPYLMFTYIEIPLKHKISVNSMKQPIFASLIMNSTLTQKKQQVRDHLLPPPSTRLPTLSWPHGSRNQGSVRTVVPILDYTALNPVPRWSQNSRVCTSESKAWTKQFDLLLFNIMLGYMSSRISGNTEIPDENYRRPVSVCGWHITMHIIQGMGHLLHGEGVNHVLIICVNHVVRIFC